MVTGSVNNVLNLRAAQSHERDGDPTHVTPPPLPSDSEKDKQEVTNGEGIIVCKTERGGRAVCARAKER